MDEMKKKREFEWLTGSKKEVGFPRKKRWARLILRLLASAAAWCAIIAVVLLLGRIGLWERIYGSAGGGPVTGGQDIAEESSDEECTEGMVGEPETDPDGGETGEPGSEGTTDNENTSENETAVTVENDLSEAERGAGYIVNYSSRSYDIEGLLEMGFHAEYYPGSSAPIVLILHTHTSEGYADFDPDDPIGILTSSVVAVGDVLSSELNRLSIPAVHCTVIHDADGDPYANAAETIEMMLKIYPTVEYVIDLHRMELTDSQGNIVRTRSARNSAQIRLTVSTSGVLTRGALSLAMCLREELNGDGARVCMPTVLTDSEYNAASSLYYLKLDVGSIGNTSDEARAAAVMFAEALADIIVG